MANTIIFLNLAYITKLAKENNYSKRNPLEDVGT